MHDNRGMKESYAIKQHHTHKIIHSSAMYYQNVIHASSKKLLKIKSVKYVLAPSINV